MSDNENRKSSEMYGKWKNALLLTFSGKSLKDRMMYPALAAFFCLLAFVFSSKQLPYTSLAIGAPLADALVCSAGMYTPFAYIGALLGSIHFGLMSIPRALSLTLAFVLRIITSSKCVRANPQREIFSENTVTRLAVSAALCFSQCAMYLPSAGINADSAKAVLATLVSTPLLTFFLSVYYSKNAESKAALFMHEAAMLFVFSCAVYCASGIDYAFITLDTLFCVFFTLCIAKFGGFARAAIYGFILGYIASPTYFVCFLIMGAVASLIFSLGTFGACGISAAAACVIAILLGGAGALMGIVPETVIACAVTTPILRYAFLPKNFPYPLNDAAYADSFSENMRCALAELSFIHSLKRASDNLKAVTGAIKEVTAPFKFYTIENEKNIDKVYSEFCEKCPISTICHDSERGRCRAAISDLLKMCSSGQKFDMNNVPIYLSSHCIRLRELTDHVKKMSKKLPSIAPQKPITPHLTYGSAADIIASIYEKAEQELVFDASAEKAVSKLLYSVGVPFGGVSVIGKNEKKVFVYGADKRKLKKAAKEFEKGLNRIFGCDYSTADSYYDEHTPIIFSPRVTFKTESAVSLLCKKGESISGDTVISFKDGSGNFYALIADGMGSGPAASKSSSVTAELLRNFMLSGIDEVLAIKLAGESLAPICDECFSTVDLIKIDLANGNATITKNHAAASYILRGGNVYCCNAHSLPIGINEETAPERMELRLSEGDTVIMVSDGVAQGPQDKLRLPDLIGLSADLNARELAERIMAKASELNANSDDMSVMVIKLSSAA